MISNGNGGLIQFFGARHDTADFAQAVEYRILAMDVKMNKRHVASDQKRELRRTTPPFYSATDYNQPANCVKTQTLP
jgi:hypothetical protein